jgi:hypothetical protein
VVEIKCNVFSNKTRRNKRNFAPLAASAFATNGRVSKNELKTKNRNTPLFTDTGKIRMRQKIDSLMAGVTEKH